MSQKARVVSNSKKTSDSEGGGGRVCWSVPSGVIVFILRNDLLQVCGSGMRHTRNDKVSLKPTLGTTNGYNWNPRCTVKPTLCNVVMHEAYVCLEPQMYECGAYYCWV